MWHWNRIARWWHTECSLVYWVMHNNNTFTETVSDTVLTTSSFWNTVQTIYLLLFMSLTMFQYCCFTHHNNAANQHFSLSLCHTQHFSCSTLVSVANCYVTIFVLCDFLMFLPFSTSFLFLTMGLNPRLPVENWGVWRQDMKTVYLALLQQNYECLLTLSVWTDSGEVDYATAVLWEDPL